jgi:hypothetical protein
MKSIIGNKKYIFIFSVFLIISCSKQPKCDSEEGVKLAKDLIRQQLNSKENTFAFAMLGLGDESSIENFVNENIEIVNVRTTAKDDELQKCDCASQITFKFSDDLEAKMKENGKDNIVFSAMNGILTKQIDYNYTLQLIEKGNNLFIEGVVPEEELKGVFTSYIMLAPKTEAKDVEINNNKSEYKLTADEANSGEIITEKSYIYKDRNFASKTRMYLVKGDVFDIGKNQNGFYDILFRAKNDKYIEGFIPEDEMRILYLDKYGTKTYVD